jgi:hypothetical protein
MWRSLFRWIFRRHVPRTAGMRTFRYAATSTPILMVFIIVSAIEVPILHLALPWEAVRIAADAAGVYGLLWMLGLLASLRAHPHVVTDDGVRVRNGFAVDLTVPWDAVASVRTRNRGLESRKAFQLERSDAGTVAQVGIMSQTNVDLVLREPTAIRAPRGGTEVVTEVRLYADDPAAFAADARRHLTTEPADASASS